MDIELLLAHKGVKNLVTLFICDFSVNVKVSFSVFSVSCATEMVPSGSKPSIYTY